MLQLPDMTEPEGHYRLELPPEPGSGALARLFVATLVRMSAAGEEVVADAKLAVSELVTEAITGEPDTWIDVLVTVTGPGLDVSVGPITGRPESERLDVAAALFPTTSVDGAERRAGFSIDPAPR